MILDLLEIRLKFLAGKRWESAGKALGKRWESAGKRWEALGKRWESAGKIYTRANIIFVALETRENNQNFKRISRRSRINIFSNFFY